jgi:hypothetical protein
MIPADQRWNYQDQGGVFKVLLERPSTAAGSTILAIIGHRLRRLDVGHG